MVSLRILGALGLGLVAACGNTDTGDSTPSSGASTGTGTAVTCQNDARLTPFSAGMSVMGGQSKFQVVLLDAEPAPPARGTNTWTIQVLDEAGKPAADPELSVKPFMPDHGHGTSVDAVITPEADGKYSVTPLYLFMPGLWQVTFSVKTQAATDSVVLSFCIAG